MYPHERSLVEKLADNSFALIGVNSDSDLEQIRETVAEKNITWRSFWNGEDGPGGPIAQQWAIRGWPTIFIIDDKGIIRYKNLRGDKLDEAITTLLAEMGEDVNLSEEEEEVAEPDTPEEASEAEAAEEEGDAKP
jgi:hypothetical protein